MKQLTYEVDGRSVATLNYQVYEGVTEPEFERFIEDEALEPDALQVKLEDLERQNTPLGGEWTIALVTSIEVDPEYRGQGIGRSLMDQWLEECAQLEADACMLVCDSHREQTNLQGTLEDWYHSLGMEQADLFISGPLMVYPASLADEIREMDHPAPAPV